MTYVTYEDVQRAEDERNAAASAFSSAEATFILARKALQYADTRLLALVAQYQDWLERSYP